MRGALSDLKAAPAVWAGVWLSLVVSQTAVCTIVAARRAIDAAYHGPDAGLGANLSGPAMLFSVVIAVFVMLWVVTAALNQRRHQLALLVLQGATPWQLLFGNLAIIIILFIVAAVASSLLTPLAAPYLFDLLARAFELKLTY
ncbi:FtsX-like permease family protein [uncultured Bifidobacterium sp.]|uniref:FtsX-like permease family protein n=1 Tax=uncultured Bifidobacterium sp. TaxID=165187 RepID=UPI0025EDF1FD|nr:FtsX-like permease family protein [uncultured Bifidobacterium sp.]